MVNIGQSVLIHFVARDDLSGPIGIMGGALLGLGAAAIKVASDFETEFAKVTSLLPESKTALEGFKKEVLDLSKTAGVDATKAMNALYESISAGVPKQNAMSFLSVAAKAAVAGVTDTTTAVDGMTSAINAFGTGFENANRTADIMFQAVNIGKMTFDQLSRSIYIAGPIAANTGVEFEEIAAAAATITKSGSTANVAMTQIRSALTALNKPSANLQAVLEKLGVTTGKELVEKMGGLQQAFEAIRGEADNSGMSLSKLFGRVEAVNGILALTGENAKTARDDLQSITHSTDAMIDAFEKIDDTPARRWARMMTEIKNAGISMGNSLLPAFEGIVEGVRGIVNAFESLPQPVKSSIGQMSLLFGTLGIGIAVMIKVAEAVKAIRLAMISLTFGPQIAMIAAVTVGLIALGEIVSRLASGGKLGLMDRIFGDGSRERQLKKDLDLITDKLAAIDELYPVGSKENTQAKERELDSLIAKFDELQDKIEDSQKTDFSLGRLGKDLKGALPFTEDYDPTADALKEVESQLAQIDKVFQDLNYRGTELKANMEGVRDALIGTFGQELGMKLYEDFEKNSKSGKELAQDLAILSDGAYNAEQAFLNGTGAIKETTISAKELEEKAEELADAFEDIVDEINNVADAFTTLNPDMMANNIQIARNNLEIAKIKNNARDATGAIRELTEAEQAQIDQLEESNKSLETQNDVYSENREVIDAAVNQLLTLAGRYKGIGSDVEGFNNKIAGLGKSLLETLGPTDQAYNVLDNLGVLLNEDISSDTAIEAVEALTDNLGSESKEWKAIVDSFPPEFWDSMIKGVGDPAEREKLQTLIKGNVETDLTVEGTNTGVSFGEGMVQGIASKEEAVISAGRRIANQLENIIRATLFIQSPSKVMYEIGVDVARGLALGIEEGSEDAEKAAQEMAQNIIGSFDNFSETLHDALRLNELQRLFGDQAAELFDAIAEAFENPSEAAGGAVAGALDGIIDDLNENFPEEEATAWGQALIDAVAKAMYDRTPEAAEEVRNLIRAIADEMDANSIAVEKADSLGDAIIEALQNKYKEMIKDEDEAFDIREDRLKEFHDNALAEIKAGKERELKELSDAEKAYEEDFENRKDALEDWIDAQELAFKAEKKARMDALEDNKKATIKAIEDEIAIRKAGIEAIKNDLQDADRADAMQDLQKKLARAKTAAERVEIQKDINKLIRKEEADALEAELNKEIDGFEDKKEIAEDDYDMRKEKLEEWYDEKERLQDIDFDNAKAALDREKDLRKEWFDGEKDRITDFWDNKKDQADQAYEDDKADLDRERELRKEYWDYMLDDATLFYEALHLMQSGNMDQLVALLGTYNTGWQNAGQSLGDALINGLNSTKVGMYDSLNEILGIINVARGGLGLPPIPEVSPGSGGGAAGSRTYTVQSGDTLSGIAAMLGMSWQDLWASNPGISDPNLIHPGQVLSYASGGWHPGGMARINESGPELINLPRGSSVMTANSTRALFKDLFKEMGTGKDGGPTVINVHLGNELLQRYVIDATNKHTRLNY